MQKDNNWTTLNSPQSSLCSFQSLWKVLTECLPSCVNASPVLLSIMFILDHCAVHYLHPVPMFSAAAARHIFSCRVGCEGVEVRVVHVQQKQERSGSRGMDGLHFHLFHALTLRSINKHADMIHWLVVLSVRLIDWFWF